MKPVTNVAKSIAGLIRQMPVKRFTPTGFVGGEAVKGTPVDSVLALAAVPMTNRDLKAFDAGDYTMLDVKFYQISGEPLKEYDQIIHENSTFVVRSISDRMFDGGYRVYFGKREK